MTEAREDLLLRQLSQLPRVPPDAARAEDLRARCRATLSSQRGHALGTWSLEMLVASAAILIYVMATAANAVQVLGMP